MSTVSIVVIFLVPFKRLSGGGVCLHSVGGGFGFVVGVSAGLLLSGFVVGVSAGLLLSALVVCLSWLFSLSLLATVRGGTSFLCPKRQRNEAKKTLSKRGPVS